ncbi:MAG TPA: malate synthase A [Acidimicrobiales bacterium]|nr:malate synthase A [Acidimicrobiales bacterium]
MSAAVEIRGEKNARRETVLNGASLALVAELQSELGRQRLELLERRRERQAELARGVRPKFRDGPAGATGAQWRVPPAPADLRDRRVEITGPTDAKMMINALNSGARVFMADFEDANTPTWSNLADGQANVHDAVRRRLSYRSPEGRDYSLGSEPATLLVRPRGWHLIERHVLVDGAPVSASLFDFGIFVANNGHELLGRGSGPYLYLAKLENADEAALWRSAFEIAESRLDLPPGSIRATVLIETILAAFEMDDILHALGPHATALNAGRWDYMFSIIKKFRDDPAFVLPDRAQVTMTVPFMHAYTELLVKTCHRRGAHAIGGMAAFVPSRRDPQVNERAIGAVRDDKRREAGAGFDGTWVAHPDLVPVATEVFDAALNGQANQLSRSREDVVVEAGELLDVAVPGGSVTEAGVRNNVAVSLRYLESWLRGTGAVAVFNLMEDVATAEIARAQVWQWCHHGVDLGDGSIVTPELVRRVEGEELEQLLKDLDAAGLGDGRAKEAAELFDEVALADEFVDFLTLPAYERID